jgi:hypothetical protein
VGGEGPGDIGGYGAGLHAQAGECGSYPNKRDIAIWDDGKNVKQKIMSMLMPTGACSHVHLDEQKM